ncbi:MAG TPA: VWA domain-containing protein [Syntrophales bacterium]|nr:VWA domain-containing protein [Syntrophales bacterium]HNS53248.1 VWA domain-containing protein [Syntrophales bacterium]
MDRVLNSFIVSLRGAGVPVSVSESIDAAQALAISGYGDRRVVKSCLGATLAKSAAEKEIFDDCFERFFSFHPLPDAFTPGPDNGGEGLPGDMPPIGGMIQEGDLGGVALAVRDAARSADLQSIRFFTQRGMFTARILQALELDRLDRYVADLYREGSAGAEGTARQLEQGRDALVDMVRRYVEQEYEIYARESTERVIERYLWDVRLTELEERHYDRMHFLIRKLVKRMNDRYSRRRRRAKRGALDFKRTLRANMHHGGLLFDTAWKKKRVNRPDVVILCDVSRSMSTVVRFCLLMLYGLNEVVARIRSFVFCSSLLEVSHVFERCPVAEAVERLRTGEGLDIHMGRTDYGSAFWDFTRKHLDAVTGKTTVIILGDGRSNYGDPAEELLEKIAARCRRLIWLNPETPSMWGTGDSEMRRYMRHCDLALECSTLRHLEQLVRVLVRIP